MKRIGILRHGKAEHHSSADFDRQLSPAGRDAAASLARQAPSGFGHPELVLTSPAARALSTAETFIRESGFDTSLEVHEEMYAAEGEELLDMIAGMPEELDSIILVGHNPSLEELIEELTGEPVRLKTAHLYIMDLDISAWTEIYSPNRVLQQKMINP
ncbi:MAG: SixA phosphatase family protein [Sediminispirochaetaceae bacterium]